MNISNNVGAQNVNYTPGIGDSTPQSLNPQADAAAGAVGAYMNANNISTIDPNGLYALANDSNGKTPPGVQQGASYLLAHPKAWKQIETHGDKASDGDSSVGNLDQAAQGMVPFSPPQAAPGELDPGATTPGFEAGGNGLDPSMIAGGAGAAAPADGGTSPSGMGLSKHARHAADTLAKTMNANDMQTMDPNTLYRLASDDSGDTPPNVKHAASYMLSHLDTYQKIETADVPGADGKSGIANFEQAAQGSPRASAGAHSNPWTSSQSGLPIERGPGPVVETGPGPSIHSEQSQGLLQRHLPQNFYTDIDSARSRA